MVEKLIDFGHVEGLVDTLTNPGYIFISDLKYMATNHGIQVNEWSVIEAWLGCCGRDFNSADKEKINTAWLSYQARGIAPSINLQKSFDSFREKAKNEKLKTIDIPMSVLNIFDRLIATEQEISQKRKYDEKIKISNEGVSSRRKWNFFDYLKSTKNIIISSFALSSLITLIIFILFAEFPKHSYSENLYISIIITIIFSAIISILTKTIMIIKSHWKTSVFLRKYCFFSIIWSALSLSYIIYEEPYINDLYYMEGDYFSYMLMIAFLPQLFIGLLIYTYEKHIK